MLRIHTSTHAGAAKSYFSTADYYSEGQELRGVWGGKAAQRLGLTGEIRQREWDRLCDNLHPHTENKLTQRQKANRRVGYDMTFDVPKSVSLLYGLTQDDRILDAFRNAVDATMEDIERDVQVRVRSKGRDEDRITGNLVYGRYVHFTSRPVNGVPDPQLHAHCYVFNASFDTEESRWKAIQMGAVKRDAPYYQALVDARLARNLSELGLSVDRSRSSWQIAGFRQNTLKKFSRRTAEIEKLAEERGISDPKFKSELGATTRSRKAKYLSMPELRDLWKERLTADEAASVKTQQSTIGRPSVPCTPSKAKEAIAFAKEHCFERRAVVPERTIFATAMKHAIGEVTPQAIRDAFDRAGFIDATIDGRRMVTTREVLAQEQAMLGFARSGRGTCAALGTDSYAFKEVKLNTGQRQAVQHLLTSPDRVMLVRGAAGVGKTTMMQEAARAIAQGPSGTGRDGKQVFVFAPSSGASRGTLREKGFHNAETVTMLLKDERRHDLMRDQVIWIDEAGQVGTRTMNKIFSLADRLNARIVLSGDKYQHGSVEAGSALHLLETDAGLKPAEITEIIRQTGEYKSIVHALSKGHVEPAFKRLNAMGWIKEVPEEQDRLLQLAGDYVDAVRSGKTVLALAPTHLEGERLTQAIRGALRQEGQVGGQEQHVPMLTSMRLTEAQKRDPASYIPGSVLVFNQNAKGFTKSERVRVDGGPSTPAQHRSVTKESLPLEQAARYDLYRAGMLALAPGDVIRITRNGQTADKAHALNNGDIFAIRGFDRKGNIRLANGWTISREYGFLDYGYVSTSYAAQGRDAQRVLISQSFASLPASSREQFYVSVSRGIESVTLFTDNKKELLEAVTRPDERLSATELVGGHGRIPDRSADKAIAQKERSGLPKRRGQTPSHSARRWPPLTGDYSRPPVPGIAAWNHPPDQPDMRREVSRDR